MRKVFTIVVCYLSLINVGLGQAGEWTWMKGNNIGGVRGTYGIKGVSSVTNSPGARERPVTWVDKNGNFWLFGGAIPNPDNSTDVFNDLWKYNVLTNEWTWINGDSSLNELGDYGNPGVPVSTNKPGARFYATSWTDLAGDLWLFGGEEKGFFRYHNDLWKYNIATNTWTWMKGDASIDNTTEYGTQGVPSINNKPRGRAGAASWIDTTGHLWMMGGSGYASSASNGFLNDLWKYDVATDQWTWVKGDKFFNRHGIYGTAGMPSINNKPGARNTSVTWSDTSGLWLFGGKGYGETTGWWVLGDLWKYTIASNSWTWINGDKEVSAQAVYGVQGISAAANRPGARTYSVSWKDTLGKLWLLGGFGHTANTYGGLNDLWRYNTASNEWTWIKGSNTIDNGSVYGTKGISSNNNKPGSRYSNASWRDHSGNLWMFGGIGYAGGTYQFFNDLWKYKPNYSTLPVHLLIFTGKLKQDKINLNWQVENEQSFSHYEVERSYNSREFTKIGRVKAVNANQYSLIDDANELRGRRVYYRLKMVDKDSKFNYSNIVRVQGLDENKFTIYPNPASSQIQLQLSKNIPGKVAVEIMDAAGKVVTSSNYTNGNNITVSTANLPAGNYTVRVTNNDVSYYSRLVVVKQ